ncbi:MAG: S-methyl-5-thioribose-1-phosphate isomerase [Firmicutes bacterium]|nr:S-methyl-5-thioribose-1-phosphate isomerase [Bacillota bacterium]
MDKCRPLRWDGEALVLLDQTKLPGEVAYITCCNHEQVAAAIKEMKVRGAPAIGAAAAYGLVLGAREACQRADFWEALLDVAERLRRTRPTAVNLAWALERMLQKAERASQDPEEALKLLTEEAAAIALEDVEVNRAIGRHGAPLLPEDGGVLTHCNAGALATVDYGTALGVIRAAVEMGKKIRVFACETRPFLQGARLTAYELKADGIPVTLITDNMAGYVMGRGLVQGVVVGADRVAANGDVANKIGTYSLAILAREHGLPFYVAAPLSTVDLATPDGEHITIEERDPTEVSHLAGIRIAPEGVDILNPAFDVTPAKYITGIITEKGVVKPPYDRGLAALFRK